MRFRAWGWYVHLDPKNDIFFYFMQKNWGKINVAYSITCKRAFSISRSMQRNYCLSYISYDSWGRKKKEEKKEEKRDACSCKPRGGGAMYGLLKASILRIEQADILFLFVFHTHAHHCFRPKKKGEGGGREL